MSLSISDWLRQARSLISAQNLNEFKGLTLHSIQDSLERAERKISQYRSVSVQKSNAATQEAILGEILSVVDRLAQAILPSAYNAY